MPVRLARTVRLSDTAYRTLAQLTIEHGYSNHHDTESVTRIRGMNLLIARTFEQNALEHWHDTRPDYLKSYDHPSEWSTSPDGTTLVEPIMVKLWRDFDAEAKMRRTIKMTDATIKKIAEVAIFHSIESHNAQSFDTSNRLMAKVGMTLEAWGSRYLTPEFVPDNPMRLTHKLYTDYPGAHKESLIF